MERECFCPKCEKQLWHLKRRGLMLELCTSCDGLWFDAGELTLFLEVFRSLENEAGKATPYRCVRCEGRHLKEVLFPGTDVLVDVCPSCRGIWLDGGEFEKIKETLSPLVPRTEPLEERARVILADMLDVVEKRGCPRCGSEFEDGTIAATRVERCSDCGGLWLDAGELNKVLGVYRKLSPKQGEPTEARCPKCPDERLLAVPYPGSAGGVLLCPDCRGNWIAAADLAALREKFDR